MSNENRDPLILEDYWVHSGGLRLMAPFNLGRSVSTHSPYHGRLREGRVGIKIEVVCKEVGSGAGCV